ncbi:helix-turn-helix domain-containing protein [Leuconostoc mesenteroides]|uniref:helix-turn-helix domain-containing protein n=1 Tax=Leuconostoc mesenteroides TaxID=1245 RepID=UPI0023622644|nr:helix-turn-helix domain-containing protein [Leuconostoc mesenteroides]
MDNKLRELRNRNNLTLTELSKQLSYLGISISADGLGKYERGDREPKLSTWKQLADFYKVPVSDLMGVDSDDMSQILLDDYLRYEKYFVEQNERMNKVPANDIAVSSIAEAMDLILTARSKYSDSSEISTYINTLMTNLKQLIINSNTSSEHDDENKNRHLYSETVNNFTTLLDKIEEQNKKASDD